MRRNFFRPLLWFAVVCVLSYPEFVVAQPGRQRQRNAVAAKPLFRDPVYDGAADPVVIWNQPKRCWYMFYTNRRANLPEEQIDGVNWVHGTKIGIARSERGTNWEYVGIANIDVGEKDSTYWAPEVIYGRGKYHMFLTLVPGVFRDWSHPRSIVHLTSEDLENWKYQSTLQLSSEKVIDACVTRLPDDTWRMWYNNEADKKSIYYADSKDLDHWTDRGKVRLPNFPGGEGPKVFSWQDHFWMVLDVWDGLAVYRSTDAENWTRQDENLLKSPGTGAEDNVKGQHADVVAMGNRAYLFYFTHPGRADSVKDTASGYDLRRSSIQVAELKLTEGWLTCDRDQPVRVNLRPSFRPQIHDPSTILESKGRYWCFATGMGVQAMVSDDLRRWEIVDPVLPEMPPWVKSVVPDQRGHYWAPDVIERDGRYWLYYSVSAFGKRTSAIALATSPSLDPMSEDFGWADQGIVIQTSEESDFNAIDPAIVTSADGKLWMVFGSFWTGIKLIELDPATGKRISPDSPIYSLAKNEKIEAAAIKRHGEYYYLFLNWGDCCRGVRSTYNIRVGRSRQITGPYLDRDGKDMLDEGGTLLLETDGRFIGPGHAGFFEYQGLEMLSYHFYDADQRGRAQLGIDRLSWDEEGWPVVDGEETIIGSLQE